MADAASDIRVIRCSSLTNYPDCARRAAAELFPKDIEAAGYKLRSMPKSIAAHIGSGVHAAGAAILIDKRDNGIWSADAAITQGIETLHKRSLEEGVAYDDQTRNVNEAEQQVKRMSLTFITYVVPKVEPIAVEERLEAEIAPGLILSGQKDNVGREPRKLRDLKTGARMKSHNPQVGGYTLLEKSHSQPVDSAVIDFIQRVSLKKDQPPPIEVAVNLADAETAAVKIVDMIVRDLNSFRFGSADGKILPGDPWSFSANPSSMLCSPKFCKACGDRGPSSFCHEWADKSA